MTNAAAANEYAANIGSDYSLACELQDFAEQEAEAEAERLEAEGRREMYAMLELTGY